MARVHLPQPEIAFVIHIKSIVKGVGSNFLESFRDPTDRVTGTFDAASSYAIFMRYLIALGCLGVLFVDKTVLEFGPGASFGMGLAALLSGARRYYAFDLIDNTTDERNVAVFDELVDLFRARAPIPSEGHHAQIFPFIEDPAFPANLLPDSTLQASLDPERIAAIRHDLVTHGDQFIRPRSSRDMKNAVLDEPVDIVVSESVFEHVDGDAVEPAYSAFARWLRPDGAMMHLIDFSSHKLTDIWNGHWECPPALWSVVRGKRYYLLNRFPLEKHMELLRAKGFKIAHCELLRRVDGLVREDFSPEFRTMSLRDATTHLASLVCFKDKA